MIRKLPIVASSVLVAVVAATVIISDLHPDSSSLSAAAARGEHEQSSDRQTPASHLQSAHTADGRADASGPSPKTAPLLSTGKSDRERPKPGSPIAGSYVVVLKDRANLRGATRIDMAAHQLSRAVGGRLASVYTAALHGFSVKMSARQAQAMRQQGRVASVTQDTVVVSTAIQTQPSWSLDRIDQPSLPLSGTYDYGTDAANTNIYMMDTGIRATHSEFGGRVKNGPPGVDNNDCQGHGTTTAGVAAGSTWGVAKAATLYAVRVLGCEGAGSATNGLDAVDWVTKNAVHPAVVNISWSTEAEDNLDTAVRNSIKSGITYVIAAGNDDRGACDESPGRVTEAIVVGASDNNDNRAGFSNYGSCLDIFAPGTDIETAAWDSDTATTNASGTSLSAPIVAGAAALYLSTHPEATPAQVSGALTNCAGTGRIGNLGANTADRLLNTACLGSSTLALTNPGQQQTVTGVPVRLATIRTTGATGSTLRYSATGLPSGLSIDPATGVISGTSSTGGTTTARVTVSDGTNSTSISFLWDVVLGYGPVANGGGLCAHNQSDGLEDGNPIELSDCGQTWIARADGTIEFASGLGHCVTASDTTNDDGRLIVISTCTGAASQIWAATTAGELRNPASGQCLTTARSSRGTQLSLRACDETAGQVWKLPTGAFPDVVTINDPGTQSMLTGDQIWLKILARSSDTTQSIHFSATGLPAGLSINPATGRISGTATTSGVVNVTITATDTAGVSASTAFRWEVADGPIIGLNGICADQGGEILGNANTVMAFQCNESDPQRWSVRSDSGLEIQGKCMTVPSGAGTGSLVPMDDCSGAPSQAWQSQDDGTLKSPASGFCLNAPSSAYRTQFTLETCNGSGNQIWTLPTGAVNLLHPGNQEFALTGAIDLPTAPDSVTRTYRARELPAGVSINTATGKISGTPTAIGDGTVIVTATNSAGQSGATAFTWTVHHGPIVGPDNNCVDDYSGISDNNNPIIVWGCHDGGTQLWTVGAKDTLEIQNKCLTVADDATAAGSLIVLFDCRDEPSQVWKQQADGTIVNPVSGRCLTAPSLAEETQFTLADCTGAAETQGWRLPTTPAITDPGDQRSVLKYTVNLKINVVGGSPAPRVFTASGLPAGLSIDPTTGVISGKVTTVGMSRTTVTVTVGKTTASASFSWEVYEVRSPGTITHSSGVWCVDSRDNAPWVFNCNGTPAQTWTVRSDGRLSLRGTNCMTPAVAGTTVGTKIVLSGCSATNASQIWQQQGQVLVNTASKLCLTADGLDYENRFTQQTCNADATQQWALPTVD